MVLLIHEVQTKALISCAVTAQLICIFVFAYAKSLFSHDGAQFIFSGVDRLDKDLTIGQMQGKIDCY